LHFAAENGHQDTVSKLLEKKRSNISQKKDILSTEAKSTEEYPKFVDAMDIHHTTALHCSARNGHFEISKLLIKNGADVNKITSDTGLTALHFFVNDENMQMVKILIAQNADINQGDINGMTALHVAAQKGNFPLFELLIKNGADTKSLMIKKTTVLQIAAGNGSIEIVDFLIKKDKAHINARNRDGFTALDFATQTNRRDVMELLVRNGGVISSYRWRRSVSIDTSAKVGSFFVAKKLIDSIVDPKIKSNSARIALESAIKGGRLDVIQTLSLSPEACETFASKLDLEENSALHVAAEKGQVDVIRYLIRKEFPIIETDGQEGVTQTGASSSSSSNIGSSSSNIGSSSSNIGSSSSSSSRDQIVQTRMPKGTRKVFDIDVLKAKDETPLLLAVKKNHLAASMILLENGANPRLMSKDGRSPLDIAIENGYEEIRKVIENRLGGDQIEANSTRRFDD